MNKKLIGVLGAFLTLAPVGMAKAMPNAITPGMATPAAPLSNGLSGPTGDDTIADGAKIEKAYYRRYYGYRRFYRYRPHYYYRPYYRPYYRHYYRRYYRPFYRPYLF